MQSLSLAKGSLALATWDGRILLLGELGFFKFYQHPVAVFGVQENHRLSMSTDLGFVTQNADLFPLQLFDGIGDIVHLAKQKRYQFSKS